MNEGGAAGARVGLAIACAVLGGAVATWLSATTAPREHAASGADVHHAAAFGRVPMAFEPNRGQADADVEFLSRGSGYGLYLTSDEIVLVVGSPGPDGSGAGASATRMRIVGGSGELEAQGSLGRTTSYIAGKDPSRWRTRIPTYRRVSYREVYPGTDLVVRGNPGRLEYDFVLEPGADPSRIELGFGREAVRLDERGDLIIDTPAGEIRQQRPYIYQPAGGGRRDVSGRFTLSGGRVGFEVGAYDRARPLVIDPVVEYSSFLGGGAGYDGSLGLAVDRRGATYLAGLTFAADFPATAGAHDEGGPGAVTCAPGQDPGFQPPPVEDCRSDAFVTKLNAAGTRVIYSTFIGGEGSDRIQDIAVDRNGSAYVTGGTDSSDFPTTGAALDETHAGDRRVMGAGLVVLSEAFVAKLSPDGSSLRYSTLLGGGDAEEATGLQVDRKGRAFVTGQTFSAGYPTTPGARDTALNTPGQPANVCSDIFASALDRSGRRLRHSTLFGGSRLEFAWDLDIDRRGSMYIMGESTSADAPTTPGALQPEGHVQSGSETADCSTPIDHFNDADPLVVALGRRGRAITYATYFGGSGHEHGTAIEARRGAVYIVGHTNSPDFPTTPGAFDRTPQGSATLFDGFAAKIVRGGRSLGYSTLVGGEGDDWVFDVDVVAGGVAFLTGITASQEFPTTSDAHDSSYLGPGAPFYDAFLTRLGGNGADLLYSTYFGASGPDVGLSVVAGQRGSVHIAGTSFSPDLETTGEATDPLFNGPLGYSDAFVTKFSGF